MTLNSDDRIQLCTDGDFETILLIINDGARAYHGVIPQDLLAQPYMSREELRHEISDGVQFWGWQEQGTLAGVMGIQPVQDVTLIRHAYVRSNQQGKGIGGRLLSHLQALATSPILIGTWAAASWAIRFYEKHGFELVPPPEKDGLLRQYWRIPERQIQTSVVLAEAGRRRSPS
ncbi:MAG TPA: GNAT family N-acetyltransferase [Bryobacteraceae bacterium]|nr:GNAT family N-acetyltransferase [Bryobacteraceae bacterium]